MNHLVMYIRRPSYTLPVLFNVSMFLCVFAIIDSSNKSYWHNQETCIDTNQYSTALSWFFFFFGQSPLTGTGLVSKPPNRVAKSRCVQFSPVTVSKADQRGWGGGSVISYQNGCTHGYKRRTVFAPFPRFASASNFQVWFDLCDSDSTDNEFIFLNYS